LSCSPQLLHTSELSPPSEAQPPAALVGCRVLAQSPTTVERTLPTNSNIDALEPLATSPSLPLLTNTKIPLKLRQGIAASTHKNFYQRVKKKSVESYMAGILIVCLS
jgi:hypothetical protein